MCEFKLAAAVRHRTGEGATRVAKQLRLDQLLGNRRAVDLDERALAPLTQQVDVACHQFLARAVFT